VRALGGEPGGPLPRLAQRGRGRGGGAGRQGRRGHRPQRLRGREQANRVPRGEQVADPQPGEPPGLGEAADHDEPGEVTVAGQRFPLPGQAVGEGLVDDDGPARPGQPEHRRARVRHGRRVGRVADEDQVRVVRHQSRVEGERERQNHPVYLVPGREQRGLRLGELRVHDDGAPGPQRPRQQHEGLGRARGEQDLTVAAPVPGRDRGDRLALVRVRR
jgi:hypothetical protein